VQDVRLSGFFTLNCVGHGGGFLRIE
jgi:hypothetical protein